MNPLRHFLALEAAALDGPGSDAHLDALAYSIPCTLHDQHESVAARQHERDLVALRECARKLTRHTPLWCARSCAPKPAHDENRMRLLGMN